MLVKQTSVNHLFRTSSALVPDGREQTRFFYLFTGWLKYVVRATGICYAPPSLPGKNVLPQHS